MVGSMKSSEVVALKNQGFSNREVARRTGLNRETVAKYWNTYQQKKDEVLKSCVDVKQVQDELVTKPSYNANGRKKRKYTEEVEKRLCELLELEKCKDRLLGDRHKQGITNMQIFEILKSEGFDIGRCTINNALALLRKDSRKKQVFIRQQYDFGERLEYDFGEVRLIIDKECKTYHMAIFASPAGKFRWCKLYTNQKKGAFLDSHVKFFEFMGGTWREVVYDNMKNVVSKFIGKNEKELNEDLIKMSAYYGFRVNVTNCFAGNEKGTVEKAVDVLRVELFALHYTFNSLDDAQEYVKSRLLKLNEDSLILEEKPYLLPYMPPLELADITTAKVDKTSLISVDTVKYSVPEELVSKRVIVKKYHDEIRVFMGNIEVCRHRRVNGNGLMQIDIMHYLNTLSHKPGAVSSSVALKSIPKLKAIFDTHYTKTPRKFIEILTENKHLDVPGIVALFKEKTSNKAEFNAISVVKPISQIDMHSRTAIANYAMLIRGGASL